MKQSLRRLAKTPAFTAVSVLTLGLGVGASTGVFTVARRALFESLPYREPDRLVHLWETNPEGRREASYPDYLAWKAAAPLASAAGYTSWTLTLSADERLEAVDAAAVTASFFSTLGVSVLNGRGFSPSDEASGAPGAAVLAAPLAMRLFGTTNVAATSSVMLEGKPFSVVGVVPPGFTFGPAGSPQVWIALQPSERHRTRGYWHWLRVIGRLRDGETPASATAALAVAGKQRAQEDPRSHGEASVTAVPLRDEIVGPVRPVLVPLAATAALVLLVAATNAGLGLLARGLARGPELAVRQALGADRARLVRELLMESLTVGALGALAGVAFARALVPMLGAALPRVTGSPLPYLQDLSLDSTALAFALLASLLAGVAAGLLPALVASRAVPAGSLGAGRSGLHRGGRLRFALVAAQTALTAVLLVGTALLARSTRTLLSVDPGFSTEKLLTLRLQLSRSVPGSSVLLLHDRILAELSSLPGSVAAASVSKLPLSGGGDTAEVREVLPPAGGGSNLRSAANPIEANVRTVSTGYFGALGLPLITGRVFDANDTRERERVIAINRSLARLLFGNADGVGSRLTFTFLEQPVTIVGVVGDENVTAPDRPITPVIYFPFSQDTERDFSVVVRTRVAPGSLAVSAASRLVSLDPGIVVAGVQPMSRLVSESPSVAPRRTVALLMGLFAALALALSAVGVANVLAWEATRRTREIGVRLALGARRADVARLLLSGALTPLAAGLLIGLPAALAAARLLASLLFRVPVSDAVSYAVTAAALGIAGLLAASVPAIRAARLDPADALRE